MHLFPSSTFHPLSSKTGLTKHQAANYSRLYTSRLPLSVHFRMARTLKSVQQFNSSTLDQVRCALDDIVQCEYPSLEELSQKDFANLYYGERPRVEEYISAVDALQEVASILFDECIAAAEEQPPFDPRYFRIFTFIEKSLSKRRLP